MSDEHTCYAVQCEEVVERGVLMCVKHWGMLPDVLQLLIQEHRNSLRSSLIEAGPGEGGLEKPSTDYKAAVFVAISCVALQEGKPLPTLARSERASQGAETPGRHKTEEPQGAFRYPD